MLRKFIASNLFETLIAAWRIQKKKSIFARTKILNETNIQNLLIFIVFLIVDFIKFRADKYHILFLFYFI